MNYVNLWRDKSLSETTAGRAQASTAEIHLKDPTQTKLGKSIKIIKILGKISGQTRLRLSLDKDLHLADSSLAVGIGFCIT